MGVSVSETNSDTSTPTVTTTANDWKNRATMPSRNSTEPKIDTSVRLAATTAKPTCSVPSIAAVRRSRRPAVADQPQARQHRRRAACFSLRGREKHAGGVSCEYTRVLAGWD